MKMRKITAVLLAVLLLFLTGCGSEDPTTTALPESTETVTETSVLPTESTQEETSSDGLPTEPATAEVLETEQLEDCLSWIGKQTKEAGIPEECIWEDDLLRTVVLKGKLFGLEADGTIELAEDMDGLKVDGVYLTCKELSYEEGKIKLEALYGAPIEEKTDKSGQTDQGVVTYAVFQSESGEVWLSKGTEEDFVRIEAFGI